MKSGFRIFKALDGGLDGGSSALGGPPRKTDNECGSRALGHNALALIIFVPLTMGVVHPEPTSGYPEHFKGHLTSKYVWG